MPMGHCPIPSSHMGDGNWEMAHWDMVSLWFLVIRYGNYETQY